MTVTRLTLMLASLALMAACSKPPPPRTVGEFMENPLLLEAALVRCTQNRAETRYEAECVNAREAVKLIEAKDEAERRAELEAQSARKREALRRTQRAAAEARRRAAEAARRHEEAAYLAQFGELPPADENPADTSANAPLAVIPEAQDDGSDYGPAYDEQFESQYEQQFDAPESPDVTAAGSNVPTIQAEPEPEPEPGSDLESIRDELRRRNEDGQ